MQTNSIHILNQAAPGGVEIVTAKVIGSLQDYHPRVYLIHGKKGDSGNVFADAGIEYVEGGSSFIRNSLMLISYLKKTNPAFVHLYNTGPTTILLARIAGVKKIVYSIRGERYGISRFHYLYARISWQLALLARPFLIANSGHTAAAFRKAISAKPQINVVYNPLVLKVNAIQRDPSSDRFNVIYCGRLSHGKNLFLWLEAAKAILRIKPYARFIVCGDGAIRPELEAYTQKLGIKDQVEFKGFVSDIGAVYREADLLLFLSSFESFGNVVIESLAYGVPVLCSDIPSLREICEDYPQFLVPLSPQTTDIIVGKLADYAALKATAERARQDVINKYSMDNHISRMREVYDRLLQWK